jgi:hypothetical protein
MQTFEEWKTILTIDFLALGLLQGGDDLSRMRRSMKEQEIGQHCWQAGESLSDAELSLLKRALGLDEEAWQSYKAKVRPGPE